MAKSAQHLTIRLSNIIIYLLNFIVLLIFILQLLPINITSWWLDNLISLQLQWSMAALLLLPLNIIRGKKHLSVFTLLLMVPLYLQFPASFASNTKPQKGPTIKIAQLNIHYQNPHIEQLLSTLNAEDFDLLVLQEVGNDQRQKITTLKQTYPYFISDSSLLDLALFSKWPIVEQKMHYLGYKGGHIIEAIIQNPQTSTPVQIFTLHPPSPRNANLWQLRNRTLEYVALQAFSSLLQYKIIIGDFNTTPWSTQFKNMLQHSQLTNSTNALGYIPSWAYSQHNKLQYLLSSAYIDHCLISNSFTVISKNYQRIPGSDHQLLVTELGMR